jgi:hypothetical protein
MQNTLTIKDINFASNHYHKYFMEQFFFFKLDHVEQRKIFTILKLSNLYKESVNELNFFHRIGTGFNSFQRFLHNVHIFQIPLGTFAQV